MFERRSPLSRRADAPRRDLGGPLRHTRDAVAAPHEAHTPPPTDAASYRYPGPWPSNPIKDVTNGARRVGPSRRVARAVWPLPNA